MDVLDNKTTLELVTSLVGEAAKASNELRCARADIEKIQGRLNFTLVLLNEVINRQGDLK
jgi:hypothetical protein